MVLVCSASLGLHVPRALTSVPRITQCMCVASASCSYSAPGLLLVSGHLGKLGSLGVQGARGAGNLTTLNVNPKGVRRDVRCCGAQKPRNHGGVTAHLSDVGRPTCGSARMISLGPEIQSHVGLGLCSGKPPLIDENKNKIG